MAEKKKQSDWQKRFSAAFSGRKLELKSKKKRKETSREKRMRERREKSGN